MKNTKTLNAVIFLVIIVIHCKPLSHASTGSVLPNNVGSWTDIVQVAVDNYHTVGLKSDGTVVAVGSNTYNRLNVASWTGIIQVAAGAFHTVGLKLE
jgi:alpha-tubulin suppressor-like RCC1 family protein